MVKVVRATAARSGASLVEVTIAFLLLAIVATATGVAAASALRFSRSAAMEMRALLLASYTMDSLLLTPSPISGNEQRDGARLEWIVVGSGAVTRLFVRAWVPGRVEPFELRALHAAPPPVLP